MEKPPAATYKEALEIQALASKHNILVMTSYGSTWHPGQYAATAAIDSGAIGPVWRLQGVQVHGGPDGERHLALDEKGAATAEKASLIRWPAQNTSRSRPAAPAALGRCYPAQHPAAQPAFQFSTDTE